MPSGASFNSDNVKRNLKALRKGVPDEVKAALYQECQIENAEVKRRTPVDRGNLRASEHVEGPFRKGRHIYAMLVAGGPSAPYAFLVHEDPYAFHKTGQWKFLESVIMESRQFMAARVAKRVDLNRAMHR